MLCRIFDFKQSKIVDSAFVNSYSDEVRIRKRSFWHMDMICCLYFVLFCVYFGFSGMIKKTDSVQRLAYFSIRIYGVQCPAYVSFYWFTAIDLIFKKIVDIGKTATDNFTRKIFMEFFVCLGYDNKSFVVNGILVAASK